MSKENFLEEHIRAEDILLGGLGFGEEASILEVHMKGEFFAGTGQWDDGEEFTFESDDEATDLEKWAVEVLSSQNVKKTGT